MKVGSIGATVLIHVATVISLVLLSRTRYAFRSSGVGAKCRASSGERPECCETLFEKINASKIAGRMSIGSVMADNANRMLSRGVLICVPACFLSDERAF